MSQNDDDFLAWLQRAMDFGFNNFCAGDYRPTVLLELPSGAHMGCELISETDSDDDEPDIDGAIELGRERIAANSDARFYALIWNGHIAGEPDSTGGVYLEAGQRSGKAVFLVQPYHCDESDRLSKIDGMQFSKLDSNLWDGKPISTQRDKTRDQQSIEINNLEDLAEEALRMGAYRLARNLEVPFLMFINGAGDIEFVEARNDACSDAQQELIDARVVIMERDDALKYALVYYGRMTVDNKKSDVMMAEVGDRRETAALIFAKKYSLSKSGGKPRIGKIFVLTDAPNLWNDPETDSEENEDDELEEGYVNIDTLDELAQEVFRLATCQLADECEDPFVFLITREAEILTHEMPLEGEHNIDEVLNEGRKLITETHDGVMAALVYFATLEIDGELRDVMVAEVEERKGDSLMYAQAYEKSKTADAPKVGERFVVTENSHLWGRA